MEEGFEIDTSPETITNGQKGLKRCSPPRPPRTMRQHFIPIRMVIIKKSDNDNHGQDETKSGLSDTAGGNVRRCSHGGKPTIRQLGSEVCT